MPSSNADYFNPATDVSGNVITLPYALAVSTGDPVVYSAGGGTPIGGLVDGQTYYAIVLSPDVIELAATACQATGPSGSGCAGIAQQPITLVAADATGRAHSHRPVGGPALARRRDPHSDHQPGPRPPPPRTAWR